MMGILPIESPGLRTAASAEVSDTFFLHTATVLSTRTINTKIKRQGSIGWNA